MPMNTMIQIGIWTGPMVDSISGNHGTAMTNIAPSKTGHSERKLKMGTYSCRLVLYLTESGIQLVPATQFPRFPLILNTLSSRQNFLLMAMHKFKSALIVGQLNRLA